MVSKLDVMTGGPSQAGKLVSTFPYGKSHLGVVRAKQADTGTKMVHIGKNTRSRIVSKGISAGHSRNCYRGLVQARLCAARVVFSGVLRTSSL